MFKSTPIYCNTSLHLSFPCPNRNSSQSMFPDCKKLHGMINEMRTLLMLHGVSIKRLPPKTSQLSCMCMTIKLERSKTAAVPLPWCVFVL